MSIDRGIRYRFRKSEAWIGKKIEHLEHEHKGRSHAQNIAIAESMAGNSKPKKNSAVTETHSRKESAREVVCRKEAAREDCGGGRHGLCGAIRELVNFSKS